LKFFLPCSFLEVEMSDVLRIGLAILAGIMPILENVVDEEARDLIHIVRAAVAAGQNEQLREGADALVTAVTTTPSSAVAVVAVEVGSRDTYLDFPERRSISCLTFYLLRLKREKNLLMMIRNILEMVRLDLLYSRIDTTVNGYNFLK